MKRNVFIVISIAIIFIGVIIFMLFSSSNKADDKPDESHYLSTETHDVSNLKEFKIEDYRWEIENFPSDKDVGRVDDASTAIEKAKELWIDKYNTMTVKPSCYINEIKIEVSYDPVKDCWHVYNSAPSNMIGGIHHAIIQNNGKVMAVWFDD